MSKAEQAPSTTLSRRRFVGAAPAAVVLAGTPVAALPQQETESPRCGGNGKRPSSPGSKRPRTKLHTRQRTSWKAAGERASAAAALVIDLEDRMLALPACPSPI